VTDVTQAREDRRAREALVLEKNVRLQELNHRVANSLQIIASVLMQRVRSVQSEETREQLRDVHHRVMSVATLQRQLAFTASGEVSLRAYFTELCASIGASMIADPNLLRLTVDADDSKTTAEKSVSMGLIVTELVINSLKHAYHGGEAKGAITVGSHAAGDPDRRRRRDRPQRRPRERQARGEAGALLGGGRGARRRLGGRRNVGHLHRRHGHLDPGPVGVGDDELAAAQVRGLGLVDFARVLRRAMERTHPPEHQREDAERDQHDHDPPRAARAFLTISHRPILSASSALRPHAGQDERTFAATARGRYAEMYGGPLGVRRTAL